MQVSFSNRPPEQIQNQQIGRAISFSFIHIHANTGHNTIYSKWKGESQVTVPTVANLSPALCMCVQRVCVCGVHANGSSLYEIDSGRNYLVEATV